MDKQNRNLLEEMIEAAEATVGVDPVAGPVVIGEKGEMVLTLSKKKTKKLKKLTSGFGEAGHVNRRVCVIVRCVSRKYVLRVMSSASNIPVLVAIAHSGAHPQFLVCEDCRHRVIDIVGTLQWEMGMIGSVRIECFWMFHGQTRWY